MPTPLLVSFVGGDDGPWRVSSMFAVVGEGLREVDRLDVVEADRSFVPGEWVLHGVTSNERYVERAERDALVGRQAPVGRATATAGALIPIRKSSAWWDLTQDERRCILEERSSHIATGLEYLPAVARRLHHSRDLGGPFDFLTWFEFSPKDTGAFDDLVGRLRATEEWEYVEHEVDIRVVRLPPEEVS